MIQAVHRSRDSREHQRTASMADGSAVRVAARRVNIGEVAVSAQGAVLNTVLGSCVSVCLYDAARRTGGMNHILIPIASSDCCREARCGVQAMELLINELMKIGADRRRFVAKAFGGGNVIAGISSPTIGERNAAFVRQFLATERVPLIAQHMGGSEAIRLHFDTGSGQAAISTVGRSVLPGLVRDEDTYFHTGLAERFHIEEPTIF